MIDESVTKILLNNESIFVILCHTFKSFILTWYSTLFLLDGSLSLSLNEFQFFFLSLSFVSWGAFSKTSCYP